MDEERWAVHPTYSKYEVSTHGRVRRVAASKGARVGRIKQPYLRRDGYLVVTIPKPRRVHALVLEAHIGPRPDGFDACHADGSRANNNLANLRWGSRSENIADARRHGTAAIHGRHPMAKLTAPEVATIRRLQFAGHATQRRIAAMFGISRSHVSELLRGGWR